MGIGALGNIVIFICFKIVPFQGEYNLNMTKVVKIDQIQGTFDSITTTCKTELNK